MAETKSEFRARVRALTGVAYRAIPLAPAGEVVASTILARRGQVYVCAAPATAPDHTTAAARASIGGGFNPDWSGACAGCEEAGQILSGHFNCGVVDHSQWYPVLRRMHLD